VILDSSAALAILFREPGFEAYEVATANAASRSISAANFVEVSMVIESRGGHGAVQQWDALVREAGIAVESVTEEQALLARQAFSDYGKGRHSAGLNFGDCFAYALAKSTGEPLLFKGEDFRQTDILPAL
jgi:ribonuclease VapC